jgi:hypothetical protein
MSFAEHQEKQRAAALRGDWHPHGTPGPLPDFIQGENAERARELYSEWQETSAYLHEVTKDAQRAATDHIAAEQERAASITTDAEQRGDGSLVREKDEAASRAASWSRAAAERIAPAEKIGQDAADAYSAHITTHALELVLQVKPVADKTHAEWLKARKTLEPAEAKQNELRALVTSIVGNSPDIWPDDIPQDHSEPAFLTEDAFGRLRQKHEPALVEAVA